MRSVRNALLLFLALLIQTSWADTIAVFGVKPDMVLLLLVYVGITGGQIEGTVFGFASGFLLDVYDPQAMGINTLANSVVGFTVGYSAIGVVSEDIRAQAVIIFLASLLRDVTYFVFASITQAVPAASVLLHYGLGTACYTACVGVGLSLLLSLRLNQESHLNARRISR